MYVYTKFYNYRHVCFRYRGKRSPDAIMAEICWRTKNIFEDSDFEKITKQMEVDDKQREDYEDSDDDDNDEYDCGEDFYISSDFSNEN